MTEDERFAMLTEVLSIKEECAGHCVRLLNKLFEELPLKAWTRRLVRAGKVSPLVYLELFGKGEGSGLEEAQGLTVEQGLNCWYEADKMANQILEEYGHDEL
jgi:hypothetical protein